MIGQIRGILVAKMPPEIHLEVGGITYEVQVPMSTLYQLPEIGQELVLHTHFVVREDAQLLYGFYDAKDKAMFRALIRVNGVGPKLGLAILSGMEVDEFTNQKDEFLEFVNYDRILHDSSYIHSKHPLQHDQKEGVLNHEIGKLLRLDQGLQSILHLRECFFFLVGYR